MEPEQKPATNEEGNKKAFAILGYIVPLLFFLPLLDEKTKNDTFSRFHANQQLILLIGFACVTFMMNILMMSIAIFISIAQIANIFLIALAIYGAYHAYKGEKKELPFIGQFKIL